jgi:hypothetical protein
MAIREAFKLGTVPVLMYRDQRTKLRVGAIVRVREHDRGEWIRAKVNEIQSSGYFQADRL